MLNVLYQFNEKYVPYACVSIVSLLENNVEQDKIRVYLLGEEVSKVSMDKLCQQVKLYNREVCVLDTTEIILKIKECQINEYRDSCAANMKLFALDYIRDEIDRLIYIDCDTIVQGDLSELMYVDMGHKPVAMVLDSVCATHKQSLGFSPKEDYYNSGIILFDVKEWQKQKCSVEIEQHIKQIRSHYMAPDQDVLNLVLKNRIAKLSPMYNLQPLHMVYPYKVYKRFFGSENYYSEDEIGRALASTKIYHCFRYLGEFPWHKNTKHPNVEMFDYYLSRSLWSGYEKKYTDKNDYVFRIERGLYRVLPKSIFIIIFKICYETFMWKSNRDSRKKHNNARM